MADFMGDIIATFRNPVWLAVSVVVFACVVGLGESWLRFKKKYAEKTAAKEASKD